MSKPILLLALAVACAGAGLTEAFADRLPEPRQAAGASLFELLKQRRSIREFAPGTLTRREVAQLLWAAQGITSPEGLRTAPSAGALYPLTLHLVVGEVEGLAPGHYRYDPVHHSLEAVASGEIRKELARTALDQLWIAQAPAAVVIGAVYPRTTGKYGERGIRYAHMEAGHAGQNLFLQAVAMGLGTVVVGAFDDDAVKSLLRLPGNEQPLSIMPIGHPRR